MTAVPYQSSALARRSPKRWADQSESTTTMTTKAGIVGRGGGFVIWGARL
jgi:hypothetical protein